MEEISSFLCVVLRFIMKCCGEILHEAINKMHSFLCFHCSKIWLFVSFFVSLGIMLLLFVAYDFVLKKAKDEEEKEKKENQS